MLHMSCFMFLDLIQKTSPKTQKSPKYSRTSKTFEKALFQRTAKSTKSPREITTHENENQASALFQAKNESIGVVSAPIPTDALYIYEICHISYIVYHVSCIVYHVSCIIYHISYMK